MITMTTTEYPMWPQKVTLNPEHAAVLRLLADGLPDASIARRLSLGPRTVARRISEIYEQLGVDTRFQAGVAAAKLGIIDVHTRQARKTA
jgi:DNA-binding NarL/FixJ family response regulator